MSAGRGTGPSFLGRAFRVAGAVALLGACWLSPGHAEPVPTLEPGTRLRVMAYPKVNSPTTGRVVAQRADTLVLRLDSYDAPELSLPWSRFASIEREVGSRPGDRPHGAMVGAEVGAAAGALLGIAASGSEGGQAASMIGGSNLGEFVLAGALAGGLLGGVIGLAVSPGASSVWERIPINPPQGMLELGARRGGLLLAWRTRF